MIDIDDIKLETSIYFVEATYFERLCLWEKYHNKNIGWEEDNSGFGQTIGYLGKGKPVAVSFFFAKLYGKRICFYEITSRYSDYMMVEKFIRKNYTKNITNAMNFHHAIIECKNVGYEQWIRKEKLLTINDKI